MKKTSALLRVSKNLRFIKNANVLKAFIFLIMFSGFSSLNAQDLFTMPQNSREVLVEDEGLICDSGGPYENYPDNTKDTLVIKPKTSGKYIKIIFDSFETEACCDKLYIYDGTDASAPLIGAYTEFPGNVLATNEEGALTLIFESNDAVNYHGFDGLFKATFEDAGITTKIITPEPYIPGARINIGVTVNNFSDEKLQNFWVYHYISTDSIFDDSDVQISGKSFYSVYPGYHQYYEYGITFPHNIAVGEYYLISRLTDFYGNYDADPENNFSSKKFEVVPAETDLFISSIQLTPNSLSAGKSFDMIFNVRNAGTQFTVSSKAAFYLSTDIHLDENDLEIAKTQNLYMYNESKSFYQFIQPVGYDKIPDGIYYLLVNVDDDSVVTETDENNNIFATQVLFKNNRSFSDINHAIKDPALFSDTVTNGTSLSVSFTISTNVYNSNIFTEVYLTKDTIPDEKTDIRISAFNISVREWERRYNYNISIYNPNITKGQYYLYFRITDPAEYDTTDNAVFSPIYIDEISTIDLHFDDIKMDNDSLLPDVPFKFTHSLVNSGSKDVPLTQIQYFVSRNDVFDLSDSLVFSRVLRDIPVGMISNLSFNYSMNGRPAGEYYLLCVADFDSTTVETDESNNIVAVPFKVVDKDNILKIDIELKEVTKPDTVNEDSMFPFEIEYFFHHSQGMETNFAVYLSQDTILDISDMYQQVYSHNIFMIPYSKMRLEGLAEIPDIESPKDYYLIFKADNYNRISEDDEINNTIIAPVHIRKKSRNIHFQIMAIDFPDVVLYNGSEVNGSVTYYNSGNIDTDSAVVKVFISGSDGKMGTEPIMEDTVMSSRNPTQVDVNFSLPDTLNNGMYDLKIMISSVNPDEDINDNNERIFTIGIEDPDIDLELKELVIVDQILSYTNNSIRISYNMINNGTTRCGLVSFACFISEDNVLSGDDLKVSEYFDRIEGIQVPGSFTRLINVDSSVPRGPYYLFIVADPENDISEFSETNNVLNAKIDLQAYDVNLVVESVETGSDEVPRNSYISVTSQIRNSGNRNSSFFYVGYYLSGDTILDDSDEQIFTRYINGWISGYSAPFNAQINIPASADTGSCYLICKADYDNLVSESNEDDNYYYTAIHVVLPFADLEFMDSNVEDTLNIVKGTFQNMKINIASNGNYFLLDHMTYSYYFSLDTVFNPFEDIYIDKYQSYISIGPGDIVESSMGFVAPPDIENGDYSMFIWMDPENKIKETDDLNNIYRIPVKLMDPDVDLVVDNLDVPADTIAVTGSMTINYDIANTGITRVLSPFYVKFFLSKDTLLSSDDHPAGSAFIPALEGNATYHQSSEISFEYTGRCYLIFEIDPNNNIAESNEENNISYYPLFIKESELDIALTRASISPETSDKTVPVSLSCRIENLSDEKLSEFSYVHYFFSTDSLYDDTDEFIGSNTLINLDGNSYSHQYYTYYPLTQGPGKYYFLFIYDFNNSVKEKDETNNMLIVPYQIGTLKPEYVLETFSTDFNNDSMNIQFSIRNIGLEGFSETTYCSLFFTNDSILSGGSSVADFPVQAIASGDSVAGSFTVALPFENYRHFFLKVDGKDQIDEADEYNNLTFGILPEGEVDIELSTTFSIGQCCPGDTVNVDLEVTNKGRINSDSILLRCSLSADEVTDESDTVIYEGKLAAFNSGESLSLSQQLVIPSDVIDGDYMLIFEGRGTRNESDYQNNTAFAFYQIISQMNTTGIAGSLYETVIYPNPASQWLNVKAKVDIEEYKVYNSMGRLVKTGRIYSRHHSIDIEQFSPGLYFLLLKTKQAEEVFRFEVAF